MSLMLKLHQQILLALLIIFLNSGMTQGEEPRKILYLKDAIQKALNNNAELKALKHETLRIEAQAAPQGSYDDPMLSFEASNFPVDTGNAREFGMTGKQISLTQKIPFPGKLSKLNHAALQKYEAGRQLYFEKQLSLIQAVKFTFFDLSLAYKKQTILEDQKKLIHQMIAIARSKFTLGKLTQAELLNFQIEEAGLMEQLLGIKKNIDSKKAELLEWMGAESATGDFSENKMPEEIQKTVINLTQINEKKTSEKMLAKNPKLKAAQFFKEAANTALSSARWNYLPDFELMATYTLRLPNNSDRGTDFISGKIGITVPIWAITKQSQELKAARQDVLRFEAAEESTRLYLVKAVRSILAAIKEAHEKIRLYEGGLFQMTEQAVQSGKSAYLAGKIEYSTLLNSINTRFKTEYNYYDALVNHEMQIAELEALLAEPLAAQSEKE
jgi:outer membrane protein, heavy metal efflux system